jgi:steroid 5-alpha reductase family enzyme
MQRFLLVTLSSLVAAAVVMGVTALIARRLGKISVVDIAWGLVFVVIAWVCAFFGSGPRGILLAVLVTVWGTRLAWHIRRRALGAGEDPRYEKMLSAAPPEKRFAYAVRRVFVVQGLAAWVVSLPLQVAAAATGSHPLGWVAALGVVVFLVGVGFEAIGDAQLARFKADPANKGKIMDRGLWAWTRHPNYFGDAAVWWGLWIIAAEVWPAVFTVFSPMVMTYFLAFATGARLLESEMAKRPGYPEYQQRTSMFFPLPPRRPKAT